MLTAIPYVLLGVFLLVGGYFFTRYRKPMRDALENQEKVAFLERRVKELTVDLIAAASDVRYLQVQTGLAADEVRPTPDRIDKARTALRVAKKLGVDDILTTTDEMVDSYRAVDSILDKAGV